MFSRPASCSTWRTYPARRPSSSATVVMPVISTSGHFRSIASAARSSMSPPKSVSRWTFLTIASRLNAIGLGQAGCPERRALIGVARDAADALVTNDEGGRDRLRVTRRAVLAGPGSLLADDD